MSGALILVREAEELPGFSLQLRPGEIPPVVLRASLAPSFAVLDEFTEIVSGLTADLESRRHLVNFLQILLPAHGDVPRSVADRERDCRDEDIQWRVQVRRRSDRNWTVQAEQPS